MGWFDANYWAPFFHRVFVREIHAFERAFVERVLPAFDGLEEEADRITEEEYDRLGQLPARDHIDMGDLAEAAFEEGLARYEELTGVRQAMLNLATAALYHMVEQQLLVFHRRQVLHPSEEYDPALFTRAVILKRFAAGGVNLRELPSWPGLQELEIVANTVKHGDGRSAEKLREIRPEILVPELFRGEKWLGRPTPVIRTPLTGESVHVSKDDFVRYAKVAVSFWEDLADAIASAG